MQHCKFDWISRINSLSCEVSKSCFQGANTQRINGFGTKLVWKLISTPDLKENQWSCLILWQWGFILSPDRTICHLVDWPSNSEGALPTEDRTFVGRDGEERHIQRLSVTANDPFGREVGRKCRPAIPSPLTFHENLSTVVLLHTINAPINNLIPLSKINLLPCFSRRGLFCPV